VVGIVLVRNLLPFVKECMGFPLEKDSTVTQFFMLLNHEQAAEANDQV
jgi:hypothetical protein